ncbi:hypothetical protein QR680_005486 [Steinernema hermaphroditum]|uniref:Uncharacterized protein n=1 Tax=Steinernema hermaphroditum TaxID=289476 RepID=A0AA39LVR2_9BILA|nr:hypothetical protein QR680_005486 [Steinernema hermaphroditum]
MKRFAPSASAPLSATPKGPHRSPPKSKSGRVRKCSKEKREQGKVLEKLRGMVGSDDHSNQLEVMQNVLDYIYFLKAQLESDGQPMESPDLQNLIRSFASSLSPKSLSPEPSSP